MLLKGVLDTDCRSAAVVDQMLPEYRLHRDTLGTKRCFYSRHV